MRRRFLPFFFVTSLSAVLYDYTATRFFSYDGLCYALDVEVGSLSSLFHPNHLLYSAIGRVIFSLLQWVGQPLRALPLLQEMNAAVAGLAVGVLFWILSQEFGWRRALGGAALFAFSLAFWSEAVDPGCYAWAALAACGLLALLLRTDEWPAFWIGVAHGVTVLFHQLLILAAPAFWVKLQRRRRPRYIAGLLSAAVGMYLVIGLAFHNGSVYELFRWILGPAGQASGPGIHFLHWWDFSFGHALAATWRAWVHMWVAPAGAFTWLEHLAVLGLTVFLVRASLRFFKNEKWEGHPITAIWVWVLAMSVFLLFYMPGTLRFRILYIPAVLYLIFALTQSTPARRIYPAAAFALGWMAAVNGGLLIGPQTRAINNPNLVRALWVSHNLNPKDVFLFAGNGPDSIVNVYLPYFAPEVNGQSLRGYIFSHPQSDLIELGKWMQNGRRNGGRVYIEAALFDPQIQAQFEEMAQWPPGILQKWLRSLGLRRDWIGMGGTYGIYRIS